MKSSTLALLASLAVNALLATFLVSRAPTEARVSSASTAATANARSTTVISDPAATGKNSPRGPVMAPATTGAAAGKWKELTAGDLRLLVAELQARGFPSEYIASVVRRLLDDRFADRVKEIYGITGELVPFWKPEASRGGIQTAMTSPEKRQAMLDLQKERQAMEKELLGDAATDAVMPPAMLVSLRQQFGDFSEEKLGKINQTIRDFQMAQSELLSGINGTMSPEIRNKMLALQTDREAAIAKLLSPEEYDDYLMRGSQTAAQLRSQLVAFNPTEEEYRTIFKLQRAFDEQYPAMATASADQARARAQATTALRDQVAAALGPERGNDYRISLEPGSAQISRLVTRLQLPTSKIGELLAVQKDVQGRANQLARSGTATGEQIESLRSEATTKIGGILGSGGLEVYRQFGGTWLNSPNLGGTGQAGPVFSIGAGGTLNIAR